MSWVLTFLGIIALVVLHELGHFTVAKAVGMRVERFSLFFPPKLFGIKRGETEYMIGAIPAGGYVKITGMSPQEIDTLDPEVAKRAYYSQAPWKRIAVILAGPGVNLLIAFVLFWAVLFTGSLSGASTLENLAPSVHAVSQTASVAAVAPGKAAAGVLRPKDRIVAVEGRPASVASTKDAISSHRCAGAQTDGCHASTPVRLTVRRAGRELALSIVPRYDKGVGRMLIGIGFGAAVKHYGVLSATGGALGGMWGITSQTVTNIVHAFTSAKLRHQFRSIVGITEVTQQAVVAGPGYALVFLGFVSLALAIINLFPFLPLDGGHILWSLGEKLRGRRISIAAMYRFSSVGIVLLMFLVINGISNDIGRLTG